MNEKIGYSLLEVQDYMDSVPAWIEV